MPVLTLNRPANFVRSRITVTDGNGAEIGEIVQENFIGKMHFRLMVRPQDVAAALAVDTALKQDARGLNMGDVTDLF